MNIDINTTNNNQYDKAARVVQSLLDGRADPSFRQSKQSGYHYYHHVDAT